MYKPSTVEHITHTTSWGCPLPVFISTATTGWTPCNSLNPPGAPTGRNAERILGISITYRGWQGHLDSKHKLAKYFGGATVTGAHDENIKAERVYTEFDFLGFMRPAAACHVKCLAKFDNINE